MSLFCSIDLVLLQALNKAKKQIAELEEELQRLMAAGGSGQGSLWYKP